MDKWLSHPTAIKILSLMIGILMWAVVHFDSEKTPNTVANLTETQEIDAVQVTPIGMDDKNYALRLLDPEVVHLTVQGSKSDFLIASRNNDYQVTVDLSQATEGRKVLPVKVNLPRGLDLIEVRPSNVTVVLERIVTKEYEVTVKTDGVPGKGYKVGQPVVKPNNRVHVTLPKDQMDLVASVGGTVSVEGEEETVNDKKMKLIAYDKEGNELTDAVISPSVVEVEIPITKPFKKLPLQIGFKGKLTDGYAISSFKQSVEQITVYGPQDVLDKYDYYDGITIDLSKLTKSGTMELDVPQLEGIATVDPLTVTFEYVIVPAETRVMSHLPVKMIGLSEGLNAKVTLPPNGMVDAIVKGASNVLAQLESKDVQLIADLSGLGPGSHDVPLEVHLPRFVDQAPNTPITITVEITDSTETITDPGGGDTGGNPATNTPDSEAVNGGEEAITGDESAGEATGNNGGATNSNANSNTGASVP
ncbi:YbbR-like domain-containing protein [Paenibacillus sp. CF384]|uniref:CdaR family protein n=1 Tax=Paenibacillus sp. CF384 TaxID=1884382 RepID=UPI000895972F|nr:CdaR family protein [Paenibacillus sp. CF384]SDX93417.1 YbbR domain-containing protein [Paenibacillus sp. CF384]